MQKPTIAIVACLTLCLTGCIRFETLIDLNSNGSGEISIRVLSNGKIKKSELVSMILGDEDSDSGDEDEPTQAVLQERFENLGGQLGKGVKLKDVSEFNRDGWTGYLAQYSFANIEDVTFAMPSKGEKADSDGPSPLKFRFAEGNPNRLVVSTVKIPKPESEEDPFGKAGLDLPQAPKSDLGLSDVMGIGIARMALSGARITTALTVDGVIESTDAQKKLTDSSVIVMDFDIDEFIKSEEFVRATREQWKFERLLEERVPGLTAITPGESISVEFSKPE